MSHPVSRLDSNLATGAGTLAITRRSPPTNLWMSSYTTATLGSSGAERTNHEGLQDCRVGLKWQIYKNHRGMSLANTGRLRVGRDWWPLYVDDLALLCLLSVGGWGPPPILPPLLNR